MSQKTLYVAVDGGATSTDMALYDAAGRRLAARHIGPSSLALKGESAWRDLLPALDALLVDAGFDPGGAREGCAVGLGLAGINNETIRRGFLDAAPALADLRVATDAYIAALGAHGGRPGAVVVVGTGSVGYRIHADGWARMAGGWGFPIDDVGSGAWLGHQAILQTLRMLDGRDPETRSPTDFYRAVLDHLGGGRAVIQEWLDAAQSTTYAELAPIVLAHAAAADPHARRLALAAGAEIDRLAAALDPARAVPLALSGGLATPLQPYLPEALTDWMRPPVGDPLSGALLLVRGAAPEERFFVGGEGAGQFRQD